LPKIGDNTNPVWAGATVTCIASGPSLTQADVDFVRGKSRVIAVNREYETAPWADVCYAADYDFWRVYLAEGLRDVFKGQLWTMSEQARKEFGISCIGRCNGDGYSIIPNTITTGGNSGYQAVHLAAYWGASRIVMLGYDMQKTGGKEHHYGKHKGQLRNGRSYPFWIKRMHPLIRDLKRRGVTLINATRSTMIPEKWVPRVTVENIAW